MRMDASDNFSTAAVCPLADPSLPSNAGLLLFSIFALALHRLPPDDLARLRAACAAARAAVDTLPRGAVWRRVDVSEAVASHPPASQPPRRTPAALRALLAQAAANGTEAIDASGLRLSDGGEGFAPFFDGGTLIVHAPALPALLSAVSSPTLTALRATGLRNSFELCCVLPLLRCNPRLRLLEIDLSLDVVFTLPGLEAVLLHPSLFIGRLNVGGGVLPLGGVRVVCESLRQRRVASLHIHPPPPHDRPIHATHVSSEDELRAAADAGVVEADEVVELAASFRASFRAAASSPAPSPVASRPALSVLSIHGVASPFHGRLGEAIAPLSWVARLSLTSLALSQHDVSAILSSLPDSPALESLTLEPLHQLACGEPCGRLVENALAGECRPPSRLHTLWLSRLGLGPDGTAAAARGLGRHAGLLKRLRIAGDVAPHALSTTRCGGDAGLLAFAAAIGDNPRLLGQFEMLDVIEKRDCGSNGAAALRAALHGSSVKLL